MNDAVSIHHQHIQRLGIEVFQIVIAGSPEIKKSSEIKIVFPYHSLNTVFKDIDDIRSRILYQNQKSNEKNGNQHDPNAEYEKYTTMKLTFNKVFD